LVVGAGEQPVRVVQRENDLAVFCEQRRQLGSNRPSARG